MLCHCATNICNLLYFIVFGCGITFFSYAIVMPQAKTYTTTLIHKICTYATNQRIYATFYYSYAIFLYSYATKKNSYLIDT